jgi:hypothetical protein
VQPDSLGVSDIPNRGLPEALRGHEVSTTTLLPVSRGSTCAGSISSRIGALGRPPALSERSHRRFGRQLIAMRRAPDVAVVAVRPHPLTILRRPWRQEDPVRPLRPHNRAVVVVLPCALTRCLRTRTCRHGGRRSHQAERGVRSSALLAVAWPFSRRVFLGKEKAPDGGDIAGGSGCS